jgi:hypothetical protein
MGLRLSSMSMNLIPENGPKINVYRLSGLKILDRFSRTGVN